MVLKNQSINGGVDWRCPLTTTGDYQVNALRKKLDNCIQVNIGRFEWVKEVPIKVNTFIWRAKQGRIPTTEALATRGVNVNSTTCCHCGDEKANYEPYISNRGL
ncbi:unnamed protein product [Lactuca virosa]|uniref:Reverse transcriptase zinc-binding domain-containing protein n=1 Tax=Lactuca virosa TaxID=75947 RepID=A0AAU9MHS7_9ASTR|nr:unnamed protein product [Lactuca virosa]